MRSSGIKKGLAVSAVSALAMTGATLLAAPANANPVTLGANQTYIGIANNEVLSVKGDGITPAGQVRLVAAAPTAAQVQFSYNDGTNHVIATVQPDSEGLFSYDWTVPVSLIGGGAITVTATQVDSNDVLLNATSQTATGVTVSGNADEVTLGSAPANGTGLWETAANDWRGVVSGSSSQSTGNITVQTYNPGPGGSVSVPATGGAFSAIADFGNYPWSSASPAVDQSLVSGTTAAGDIDVHEYNLYKQTIGNVTASGSPSAVQTGQSSTVTIAATDQKGAPIAGAKVYSFDPSTAAPQAGTLVGTTNASGKVTTTVNAAGTYNYFVESYTTPTPGAYSAGVDYPVAVTIGSSVASNSSTTSKLGNAFDIDEAADSSATGNFTETVLDQGGNPVQGKNVFYHWHYVPFTPTTTDKVTDFPTQMGTTDANGKVALAFPTVGGTYQGGTFTLVGYAKTTLTSPPQAPGDLVLNSYSVKVGQASVVWSTTENSGTSQVQSQSTQVLKGNLQLADGTVLTGIGRLVNIAWAPGSSDAIMAAVNAQPAGVTRQSNTQAQVRTAADGSFSVALTDPTAANHPTSEQGTLTAAGVTGDSNPPEPFSNGVGTNTNGAETVQFLNNLAPSKVVINDSGEDTPGEAATLTLHVYNVDGVPLASSVNVSTDHGYLDQPNALGNANQLPSSLTGVYKNDGTSNVPVVTDASGSGYIYTAIGRDSGFDASGLVKANITAVDGAAHATDAHQWSTQAGNDLGGAPMNWLPNAVTLSFTANQSQEATQNPPGYTSGDDGVTSLPAAAGNRFVWLDTVVTDQFGNRTAANVDLASVGSGAGLNENSVNGQFVNDSPTLIAYDNTGRTVDQTITASVTGASSNSVDAHGNPVAPVTDIAESSAQTINWYAIDYANSTFTLTHTGASSQAVNSTVTVKYHAVDQKGNPIVGLPVAFYRGGPDLNQNGQQVQQFFNGTTDQNGNAYYVFKGVAAGVGSITAIPADQNGNPITSAQRDTSVTFVAPAKVTIHPTLRVSHASPTVDRLFATAETGQAAGARVNFFLVAPNGHRTFVGFAHAGPHGVAILLHHAPKGTRRYVAVFSATAKTKAGTTPIRSIR